MSVLIQLPFPKHLFAAWNSALHYLLGTLTHVHGNMAPELTIERKYQYMKSNLFEELFHGIGGSYL